MFSWRSIRSEIPPTKKQVCQVKGTQSAFAALKTDGTIVTWGCGTTGHVAEENAMSIIDIYLYIHTYIRTIHIYSIHIVVNMNMFDRQLMRVRVIFSFGKLLGGSF